MRKATTHYILTTTMALLSLAEGISGFVLWLAFPRGGGRGGGGELTFWAVSKNTWIDIHDWVAVALLVVVIIHIVLHWDWIVRMTKSYFKRPGASV